MPFPRDVQLISELDGIGTQGDWKTLRLPGQPNIRLGELDRLWTYLEREFYSAELEKLAPRLWMMSTQSSANISPLHRQKVKNRRIIITEDPQLHLVWVDDKIFIKPLPPYLLSHAFWAEYLQPRPTNPSTTSPQARVTPAALGFLRTYTHLIRHESDFHLAQESRLLPVSVPWTAFADFASAVAQSVLDADVSDRYAYGELRLSRLNFYAKIFLRRFYFQRRFPQYGSYFAQFFAPILFVFGLLSVVLGAMQVATATEGLLPEEATWPNFWQVCRWFSVLALGLILVICVVFGGLFAYRFVGEWCYAIRDRRRKRTMCRSKREESMV